MSKLSTALHLLKTPGKMIVPLADMGFFNWLPDKPYLKLVYRGEMGKRLDLEHPQTFNEKLQWLKLYDHNPLYHQLVDKYEVKQFIADRIGQKYIIPTLGIWHSVEEIAFDQLPEQFVLKCTHDSGSVIICKDKKTFDIEAAKRKLSFHLKKSTYWFGREWPYKGLIPRIIAEPYLEDDTGGLVDYKVLCFAGEPKLIEVHAGRMSDNHTQDFYTTDWVRTDIVQTCEPMSADVIPAPEQLELMLSLSKKLAQGFIHIRVDWYIVSGQLLFGELTFYDGSGFAEFVDEKWDMEIGSWIKLPEEKNSRKKENRPKETK